MDQIKPTNAYDNRNLFVKPNVNDARDYFRSKALKKESKAATVKKVQRFCRSGVPVHKP